MKASVVSTKLDNGSFVHSVRFGDNPFNEESAINCASIDDARKLRDKFARMISLLALNVECGIYESEVHPVIKDVFCDA